MTTLFHHSEAPRRHALHAVLHVGATVLLVTVAGFEATNLLHTVAGAVYGSGSREQLIFSLATVSSAHTVTGAIREVLAIARSAVR